MSNGVKIKDVVDGYFYWYEIIDHLNGSGTSLLLGDEFEVVIWFKDYLRIIKSFP